MSDNKNTTNLKEQGKENKRELIKEDEYYSKVNEIYERYHILKEYKFSYHHIEILYMHILLFHI